MAMAAILPFITVLLLWSIHLLDKAYGLELNRFGIQPRETAGAWGILAMPFLHSHHENSSHLISNSVPLFFLGWALLYFYPRTAGRVVLVSWLLGGALVWLTGRGSLHIGASGVVYGLAGFLFTSGVLRGQRTLMALSLLVVFLYGSMVWGVLPILPNISWEGHLWGMASGVVLAFLYRRVPPAVSDPKPIHFDEDEEEELDLPYDGQGHGHTISGLGSAPLRIVMHPRQEQPDDQPQPQGPQDRPHDPRSSNTWENGGPIG
jgi:membrane associated rhomboid family serine protease